MNILFVTGHPAQVHNFRLVREELIKHGHQVFWLTTPKDIATNLLDVYNIQYTKLLKADKTFISRMKVMLYNTLLVMKCLRQNKIDVCITRTDPYTAIAAKLCHVPNIMLQDTEHAAVSRLQGPFAKYGSAYLVPDSFWYEVLSKQLRFPGNIEMFYCRPGRYVPQSPYELLGISPSTRYAIVRFVKWDAFHDSKLIGGYTPEDKIRLARELEKADLKVFITSEDKLPTELEPNKIHIPIERMHDVMAHAALFIGESSSMASECVVLGTPAIYVDQVGRGYTDEEAREGLLYMYRPVPTKAEVAKDDKEFILGGRKESIEKAIELASPSFERAAWKQRHQAWMDTKFDCTAWLTWFIENYPQSEQQWRENRVELEKQFK